MIVQRHARFPIHAGPKTTGRNLLFGRAVIADAFVAGVHAFHAGAGFADAVVDDELRVQRTQIGIKIHAAFVGPGRFPFAVEPHNAGMIIRHEFFQLALHIIGEAIHVRRAGGDIVPRAARAPIGAVPVHDGMIEAKFDAGFFALGGKFGERIALERRGFDAPIRLRRGPHAKSIVMF